MIITSDWIDRYNDDELDDPEKRSFRGQMKQNPLLRTEVYIDERINRLFRDDDILEMMAKVGKVTGKSGRKGFTMIHLLIAASAICLIAIGAILFFNTRSLAPQPALVRSALPVVKKEKGKADVPVKDATGNSERVTAPLELPPKSNQVLLAANFKPMAEFELLAGSVTRTTRVRLLTPDADARASAGSPVKFTWVTQANGQPVTIVLLNNLGNLVFETTPVQETFYTLQTEKLAPGLYYWKIMLPDDELAMMGKLSLF